MRLLRRADGSAEERIPADLIVDATGRGSRASRRTAGRRHRGCAADALCSFNPIFGQGMSVAALEAEALGTVLRENADGAWRRFYPAAARIVDAPWSIAVGNDLRFEEVNGKRTLAGKLIGAYFSPAPTQEAAAERLGMPFSTYRRHLGNAVDRIVAFLWHRELHGWSA